MTIAKLSRQEEMVAKEPHCLVAGRFQVKIRSPEGQLNEQDRVSWLQKFDLSGIELLAN